jgi:membrane protein implicated in regulation of membrane protease activity
MRGDSSARMRAKLYPILLLFVLLSLPWVFPAGSAGRIMGFPAWAVYSLFVSFVYACVVSFFVWRFWDSGEETEDVSKDSETGDEA